MCSISQYKNLNIIYILECQMHGSLSKTGNGVKAMSIKHVSHVDFDI